MSVVDWVCKKISLERASEQLSAITISRQQQQMLPIKHDACANVTICCLSLRVGTDVKGFERNRKVILYQLVSSVVFILLRDTIASLEDSSSHFVPFIIYVLFVTRSERKGIV